MRFFCFLLALAWTVPSPAIDHFYPDWLSPQRVDGTWECHLGPNESNVVTVNIDEKAGTLKVRSETNGAVNFATSGFYHTYWTRRDNAGKLEFYRMTSGNQNLIFYPNGKVLYRESWACRHLSRP